MFKRERQFNIISGTVQNDYVLHRAHSCASQIEQYHSETRRAQQNHNESIAVAKKVSKLGVPNDSKAFKYSYIENSIPLIHKKLSQREPEGQQSGNQKVHVGSTAKNTEKDVPIMNREHSSKSTMMNYVSTGYNILNGKEQMDTAKIVRHSDFEKKMPEINKKSPLTEHLHRARLYAPNYHEDYQQKMSNHQFYRKSGPCASVCDIQKTYGQNKYFRNLK